MSVSRGRTRQDSPFRSQRNGKRAEAPPTHELGELDPSSWQAPAGLEGDDASEHLLPKQADDASEPSEALLDHPTTDPTEPLIPNQLSLDPRDWAVFDSKEGTKFVISRMMQSDFEECASQCALPQSTAAVEALDVQTDFAAAERQSMIACLSSGLSVTVRNYNTKELAAAFFVKQSNPFDVQEVDNSRMKIMFGVGEKLYEAGSRSDPGFNVSLMRGKAMHMYKGFTRASYENSGIGTGLRQYMHHHAAVHGFEALCVEPANPKARKKWKKNHSYTVLHSIVLADYEHTDGSKPFLQLDSKEEISLCVKKVDQSSCWFNCPVLHLMLCCCSCCFLNSFAEPPQTKKILWLQPNGKFKHELLTVAVQSAVIGCRFD